MGESRSSRYPSSEDRRFSCRGGAGYPVRIGKESGRPQHLDGGAFRHEIECQGYASRPPQRGGRRHVLQLSQGRRSCVSEGYTGGAWQVSRRETLGLVIDSVLWSIPAPIPICSHQGQSAFSLVSAGNCTWRADPQDPFTNLSGKPLSQPLRNNRKDSKKSS